jgi:hypothetical protein
MKQISIDVLVLILKNFDVAAFIVALLAALLGIFVSMVVGSTKRDVSSDRTPRQHSWLFLLKDNVIRVITNLFLIAILLTWSQNIFGATVTSWLGFLLGLAGDYVAIIVQRIVRFARKKVKISADAAFGPDDEVEGLKLLDGGPGGTDPGKDKDQPPKP